MFAFFLSFFTFFSFVFFSLLKRYPDMLLSTYMDDILHSIDKVLASVDTEAYISLLQIYFSVQL